jgi:hypothetical protein
MIRMIFGRSAVVSENPMVQVKMSVRSEQRIFMGWRDTGI